MEAHFERIAALGAGTSVVLCDRGVMDVLAYLNYSDWREVFEELGANLIKLRDDDYHGVVYMSSQNKENTSENHIKK